MAADGRIKVLIVDDSAIVRKVLTGMLSAEPGLEVVGTAPDPYVARDKILALGPDVLTLDLEMPGMDGLTFLKRLMRYHPMPVIVVSSLGQASCQAAIAALREGAVEVMAKPGGPYSVGDVGPELVRKIRAAAAARVRRAHPAGPAVPAQPFSLKRLIAIGASTGGTEAIESVLARLPASIPGMVIVQHIPAGFSTAFAGRLNKICRMEVREAADGDRVGPGRAIVAPGNRHMLLRPAGDGYRVALRDGPPVCYQRPAVDVLFESVAEFAGARAVGVILTGMGCDGAQGLLKMKQAGAATIAQDEASSVVFGMPKEAIRAGAVEQVVSLQDLPGAIQAALRRGPASRPAGTVDM